VKFSGLHPHFVAVISRTCLQGYAELLAEACDAHVGTLKSADEMAASLLTLPCLRLPSGFAPWVHAFLSIFRAKRMKECPMVSRRVDEALYGGFEIGAVTELSGPSGSGKTQVRLSAQSCPHFLALTVLALTRLPS
jgi:hypothetical protein